MKRIGVGVVITLLAVAGCGGKEPAAAPPTPAAGSTAASTTPATPLPAAASATPSATPATAVEFTVDGAGPYQIDAALADLRSARALDDIHPDDACPGNTTARGTGDWKDVQLSFGKDGKLYLAVNSSPSIPTPSGAWLGTSLAQLKTIYAGVTNQQLTHAGSVAFLVVTLSGRGILFQLDAASKVTSMIAGDAAYLKSHYVNGTTFC